MVTTNRPATGWNANGATPSVTARQRLIRDGINKSRLLCQQPPLTAELLSMTAAAWDEALNVIPTAWLERAFTAALRARQPGHILSDADVRAAWDGMLDERQAVAASADRQLPAGPVQVCATCGGKGWLVDRAHGTPGHRDLIRCACGTSGGPAPDRGREDYTVAALLVILQAWCAEHRDGLAFPVRLAYALACKAAGAPPYDLRRLLESTGEPTLYRALTALEIAVEPPPAPGTHDPRSIGAMLEGTPR